jgi:general secretion pathway protein L
MPDRLLLRLAPDGGFAWLRQAADGRVAAPSQVGKPPAAVLATTSEVIVLVPAEDVLLIETRVNARSSAQLLQAVPFAIEDQLLGAVEDLHFAIVAGTADQVGVAVVARTRMREWLAQLDAAGIRADVVLPETLALPVAPDSASAMIEDGRALARLAPWSAFACAPADLPAWLQQVRAAGVDRAIEVHDFGRDPLPVLSKSTVAHHADQYDPLAFLARNLRAPALNLLGGEFAAGHRQARGTRWWRRAFALAAAAVVLAFVYRGVEVSQLSRSVDRVDAAMADSLLKTFPDLGAAERARAPQSVMRDRLERLRGGSESTGLLRLLGQIAPTLGSTTRTQTRGMEYRNGILEIALRSPDVAMLDSLREQFAAVPGLSAEVTAANPVDAGIDGRIRISGSTR